MAAISQLRDLLRPPDDVKFVLEATLVTSSESSNSNPTQDTRNRRLLAAVAHKDDWNLTEEGCLLVCKFKPGLNGQAEELEIQKVFPIYGQFSIVISQMRRGTVNLQPALLEQPRSVITLSVNPAEGLPNDAQAPMLFTYDVQGLKNLVAECKRLKEACDVEANAVVNLASSTTYFSWVRPYLEKSSTIASLTTMVQDLRLINKPLIERLSPACAGTTGDDHADLQLIRDDWVRVNARRMATKGRRSLTLRVGTFNVNGKMPSQDLSVWIQGSAGGTAAATTTKRDSMATLLPPVKTVSPFSLREFIPNPFDWVAPKTPGEEKGLEEEESLPRRVDESDPDDPDMLVLGFQELDLSTEALLYSTRTTREDAWTLAVFAALGEKAVKYEKLVSKQLVGMLLIVMVKKSLKSCFGDVRTTAIGAGILGVMGNKGGTAVRLTFTPPGSSTTAESEKASESSTPLGSTVLTFVNAHLAAFDEMAEKRNADFQDLSKRLLFESSNSAGESEGSEQAAEGGVGSGNDGSMFSRPFSVYEADVLFWMVDLNYRIDLTDTQIRRILRDEEWENALKFEALLRFDQLKKAMKENKAFVDFREHPITHMPSYRFSPGLMMDSLGYDLKRKPAWTDRILSMCSPLCRLDQVSYTSHSEIVMSDHRPVSAEFSLTVDEYDTESLQSNIRQLFQDMDHLDGDGTHSRGSLKIEDTYVDFEKISYGSRVERKVLVTNTSKAPCAFRFVPVQLDNPIHPEWLDINPMMGVLLPNESTHITLTAHVDDEIAAMLNQRSSDLSGTLILHTVLGKDHFISVSAEYQYTCFANKLSRLTRLRGPIRSMESPHALLPENHAMNAPREIMRVINWMMSNSTNTEEMFLQPGDDKMVANIRECLDTGAEFPYAPDSQDPKIPLAFATTLLQFLDSLVDPVIPASLHAQCVEMTNRDEAFELLDALPPVSVNVWISLTAFLHFLCQGTKAELHAEQIATVFAPILLRDDPASLNPPISPNGKRKFLLYFIS
ncbi:DNase I-like protein [Agrocybe pediades]|nr:DNase I-like protein [Agrocybe pediades]